MREARWSNLVCPAPYPKYWMKRITSIASWQSLIYYISKNTAWKAALVPRPKWQNQQSKDILISGDLITVRTSLYHGFSCITTSTFVNVVIQVIQPESRVSISSSEAPEAPWSLCQIWDIKQIEIVCNDLFYNVCQTASKFWHCDCNKTALYRWWIN